jgi:hypothetical protein
MTASSTQRPQPREDREEVLTYRGVARQHPPVPSRFIREQIRKAIEEAIAKNAAVIAAIR